MSRLLCLVPRQSRYLLWPEKLLRALFGVERYSMLVFSVLDKRIEKCREIRTGGGAGLP